MSDIASLKLALDDYSLDLNGVFTINNQFTGQTFTFHPQLQKLPDLFQTVGQLQQLIKCSTLKFAQNVLTVSFKLGPLVKQIKLQFKKTSKSFEQQTKDLLIIVNKLRTENNQKDDKIDNIKKKYQKQIHCLQKQVQELQKFKTSVNNKYVEWQKTHCGGCAKPLKQFYKNAYGRPTCSLECCNYVEGSLRWEPTVDLGL